MQKCVDLEAGGKTRSLHSTLPNHWFVPLLLVLTLGVLVAGQILPCMKITKYWGIQKTDVSILQGVMQLYGSGSYFLATVILIFSILFPIVKLSMLLVLWLKSFTRHGRKAYLHWLSALGKWSMLDVFLAALVIFVTQARGLIKVQSMPGIYLFAVAICASIALAVWVFRLADAIDESSRPPFEGQSPQRWRAEPDSQRGTSDRLEAEAQED